MIYAAKSAAQAEGPWIVPGDAPVTIGGHECRQSWLAGLSEDDLAELGLVRGELDETPAPVGVKVLGSSIIDVDGVPTVAWGAQGYSPEEIAAIQAAIVLQIKAEAGRRILAVYPAWKQLNMTKRAVELADLRQDRSLTGPEEAERTALKAAAAWVDAIRSASDDIEATVPDDGETLEGWTAEAVASHELWPE